SGEKDIEDILRKEFAPKQMQVQDVSGGCGSFYSIVIVSSKFKGITTVKAHRLVNAALKDIIKEIHGLQLRT
ncbi:bola-like protein, partial [Meira miltonrushii]